MKKIAILTLCGNTNFGNKLQNYALKVFLEKQKHMVNTLWINDEDFSKKSFIKKLGFIKYKLQLFLSKRSNIFKKFNPYLNYSKGKIDSLKDLKEIENNYDYFIVGSDQVWNYTYVDKLKVFLLEGISNNKRISYAASIGVDKVADEYKEDFKNNIEKFKSVSIREDRGKEILEELTGRKDVEVLVDPTMLLTAEEWDKISKKPKMLKTNKYILNYFLGELSEERNKEIERVAKENDCEIINILDKNSSFYECGPSEFLYLEKNAFLVCTDSFHSSVFAILYNTPFLVFDREDKIESMSSRIETLLSKFNLDNRKYTGKITSKDLNANYNEAYKILEKEREKSKNFLEKALRQED